jgi:hypothetical protein
MIANNGAPTPDKVTEAIATRVHHEQIGPVPHRGLRVPRHKPAQRRLFEPSNGRTASIRLELPFASALDRASRAARLGRLDGATSLLAQRSDMP